MKEIRIYVEGGGDRKEGKQAVRLGFDQFLKPIKNEARKKRVRWAVIACGGRDQTFKRFKSALAIYPNAFNILLVDAEAPVMVKSPWAHLKQRDQWEQPEKGSDDQCHLMVQTMEAWLIADSEALETFYGKNFHSSTIPKTTNVEKIPKKDLEPFLKAASEKTQKGKYHKIKHGPKILGLLKINQVKKVAPHFIRFIDILNQVLKKES